MFVTAGLTWGFLSILCGSRTANITTSLLQLMISSTFLCMFLLYSSNAFAGCDGFLFQKMQTMASNMPYCFLRR